MDRYTDDDLHLGGSQTHLYACWLATASFFNTLSVFMVVVSIGRQTGQLVAIFVF